MTNHPLPLLAKEGTEITPLKDLLNEFCNTLTEITPLKDFLSELCNTLTEITPLKDFLSELCNTLRDLRDGTLAIVGTKRLRPESACRLSGRSHNS